MTAIGHFSLISETVENPSIATFLLTLETPKHQPWTVERFCQLWKDSEMSERHPRFHLSVADEEKGYFRQHEKDEVEFYVSESLPPMVPRLDVLERIKSWQTERVGANHQKAHHLGHYIISSHDFLLRIFYIILVGLWRKALANYFSSLDEGRNGWYYKSESSCRISFVVALDNALSNGQGR